MKFNFLGPSILASFACLTGCASKRSGDLAPTPNHVAAASDQLDGAWRIVKRVWETKDSTIIVNYSHGLLIVTKGYYSLMYVTDDSARGRLPENREPTDAEYARAFAYFVANAGRFDRTDSTVKMTYTVAKHPNLMDGKTSFTTKWEIKGDTLWLGRDVHDTGESKRVWRRRTTYIRARE